MSRGLAFVMASVAQGDLLPLHCSDFTLAKGNAGHMGQA